MQNTNRKVFENLISRTKIYLAIIFILLVILSIEDRRMIIPCNSSFYCNHGIYILCKQ